jgi:single-stranded-DNA-specific exonuclease
MLDRSPQLAGHPKTPQLRQRQAPKAAVSALESAGVHPLLARLYAARGLTQANETNDQLGDLLPPAQMNNLELAAQCLANAIKNQERLLVVADFDADGATACAVAVRGLRRFGAMVDFLVPDRFVFGYGLTPALVEHAVKEAGDQKPHWIITVDNGVSSIDGVACAKAHGINVLVTDHHLPGTRLPDALIVNPNLKDCPFPSKHLAGVGVMFYVLMALRAHLRDQCGWPKEKCPRLDDLLAIVALGTVADVVKLDANNRRLVSQGLQRIRRGHSFAGINALFAVAGVDVRSASATSLGFSIGPRINAAGRLGDMRIGIDCLLEDDPSRALQLAQTLDQINQARREIEAQARDEALAQAMAAISLEALPTESQFTLALHDDRWHQGVVGLIAGKLKEEFHRPTIIFASDRENPTQLKGSGRSIAGVHLRDILERIDTQNPGLIGAFGGHAMAAGLTIAKSNLNQFIEHFEATARQYADPADLEQIFEHDGPLDPDWLRLDIAQLIEQQIWGQGFPAPVFCNRFKVLSQRRLKEKHLKLSLVLAEPTDPADPANAWPDRQEARPTQKKASGHLVQKIEAIWFNASQDLPQEAQLAYRLSTNSWQGLTSLQLEIVMQLPTRLVA